MKKIFGLILLCATMLISTSCEKEGIHKNSIRGLYYYEYGHEYNHPQRDVYNFTSKNSVTYYSCLTKDPFEKWSYGENIRFEERSGWWRSEYNIWTLTYYIVDNKVYISNGHTLTISGNTLIRDGNGKQVFRIWN